MTRMESRWVLAALVLMGPAAQGSRHRIVDVGLHRQWRMETDSAHPAAPPRLVEVPWSDAAAQPARQPGALPAAAPIEVRAGAQVTLCRQGPNEQMRLRGTALEAGRIGDVIRVRAGLHGTVLRGVVRGAGVVELGGR